MNNFLNQEFLNNQVRDYVWIIGVILFVIILKKFISRYLAIFLCSIFKRQWKSFDEEKFIGLVVHPLGIFLIITVAIISLYRLNFPEDLDIDIYKYPLHKIFLTLAIIIQVLAFIWLLMRIIDFIANALQKRAIQDLEEHQLIVFFRDFLKVLLGIAGGLMVLYFAFNYNVNSLLTGLSIVGAAIALALKESLENLIASFVIFFDKPFTTGDLVRVLNITGVVERIGLRSTRIRSDQKTYVTVPNKQMVDSVLDNHSLRSQQRNELLLQLSLDTSSEKLEELIKEIRDYLCSLKKVNLFNVLFNDINIQAYVIQVEFFIPAVYVAEFNIIKQEVNLFALKTTEKLGVRIAGSGKEKNLQ